MPWEVTDQYIRSGHKASGETCRTITVSDSEGIKAIYCKYGEKWDIQSYLFDKDKWTLDRAKTWFSSHHENMHSDFERILSLFIKRYGEEVGTQKFYNFIDLNGLNISKSYNPIIQFRESFQWIEPLIKFYKKDRDAKFYMVRALTANISMNNNDYEDYDEMKYASKSMNYRPVNLNHHQWLPFPRTRADFAKADDFSVEATLRVDNQDTWLQKKLDNNEILHVSIEGRPEPWGGYHFTGLALLEKGVELPGDPLSEIYPLVLNESIGKAVCRLIDGKVVCDASCGAPSTLKESEEILSEQLTEEEIKAKMLELTDQIKQITDQLYGKEDDEQTKQLHVELAALEAKKQGLEDLLARMATAQATMTEQEELPTPNQCVCPECGQIDDKTEETCDLQKCSECGHQMRQHPSEPAHPGLGGGEAVWSAEDINDLPDSSFAYIEPGGSKDEQGKTVPRSLRHLPYKDAGGKVDYDHVRNALARLNQVQGLSAEKEAQIRNMLQNLLKQENPEYEPEEKIAEQAKEIADAKEREVELQKEIEELKTTIAELRSKLAKCNETNATKDRELGENTALKAENQESHQTIAKLKEEKAKLSGKNTKLQEDLKDLREDIQIEEEKNIKLQEKIGGLKVTLDKTRRDLNDESTKRAASEQKTLNETKERGRIQLENADLRDETAKLTREISVLSEKRAEDAKKINRQEKEIAEIKESIRTVEAEKDKAFKQRNKERRRGDWWQRKAEEAGVVIVS